MTTLPDNKVAVVTGASVGIGGATAERLLADGWQVVGIDVDLAGFDELAAAHPARAAGVHDDVANPDAHERAVALARELGVLCGWVNNAGIENTTRAHDFSEVDYRAVLDINCDGVAYGCRAALDAFISNAVPGRIVNVSSVRGISSFPDGFAYEAAKGAVEQMTRSIAVQYGHLGIRCNAVRPGAILTPLAERMDIGEAPDREARIREIGEMHPLERRMIMPDEVAAAIAFLLSDDASAISGAALNVDAAMTARCFPVPLTDDIQFDSSHSDNAR